MIPPWNDTEGGFPPRQHVVDYLTAYEQRYELAPLRPHRVRSVTRADDDPRGRLLVSAPDLLFSARVVVSATGTWDQPFWPSCPGAADFEGRLLHADGYSTPQEFAGQRVAAVRCPGGDILPPVVRARFPPHRESIGRSAGRNARTDSGRCGRTAPSHCGGKMPR